MARRLLGPENAASVLEPQSEENAQDTQVSYVLVYLFFNFSVHNAGNSSCFQK